jgi:hypothetical protein
MTMSRFGLIIRSQEKVGTQAEERQAAAERSNCTEKRRNPSMIGEAVRSIHMTLISTLLTSHSPLVLHPISSTTDDIGDDQGSLGYGKLIAFAPRVETGQQKRLYSMASPLS